MIRRIATLALIWVALATLLVAHATALVAHATVARADSRAAFREGVRAYEEGRWADAAVLLRTAVAEDPRDSKERVTIAGLRRIPYVPNVVLALALAKTGRCEEAVPYMEAAVAHDIAGADAPVFYRQMVMVRAECGRELRATWVADADSAIAEGRRVATEIAAILARPRIARILADAGQVAERAARARELLDSAATLLDGGRRSNDPKELRDASRSAASGRDQLLEIRGEVVARLREAVTQILEPVNRAVRAAEQAQSRFQGLRDGPVADAALSDSTDLGQRAAAAAGQLNEAREKIRAARERKDPFELDEASELAAAAEKAYTDLHAAATRALAKVAADSRPAAKTSDAAATPKVAPPVAGTPGVAGTPPQTDLTPAGTPSATAGATTRETAPVQLGDGARFYFAGDYQSTLDTLVVDSTWPARARAHAHLLRAAAYFARFRSGGEADPELLSAARSELAQGRAADASVSADARFFPPAFIALAATRP